MKDGVYPYRPSHSDEPVAAWIIQDANQTGIYYRVIYWFHADDESHFCISRPAGDPSGWSFSKPLTSMVPGEVVENLTTGAKYMVHSPPIMNPLIRGEFVRVLTRVDEK